MFIFNRLRSRTAAARDRRRRPALVVELLEDRTVPTLLGQQLFPSDNPWNQPIANAPVAANSAAIMNAIISAYGNGSLHPDFGQDTHSSGWLYGIPYNVVHGNSTPKVHVVVGAYAGESDLQDAPIPANAVLEGDKQNGPTVGLANRGDSHLLVYDEDNNVAYEFYAASRPSENSDGHWHAAQESVWNLNADTFRTLGWTSADAAGLPVLPGLVRPDEALPVSQGGQGVINHAIRFTLKNAVILNQFLYPASHTANPGNTNPATEPPMGARFRLKAGVDISALNPESKVIAQAMKDYGMIVADNGSNFFFSGARYAVDASNGFTLTWNDSDIQDTVHGLKSLTFSDFEVVNLTPVVTGLSASSGAAGSTVTVTGQNFSGAAGHLQVLFGSTPATSVTVVDDGHVQAVVPAGSGTVDVRVQSGVADPNDPSNVNSPIFGYGISATSAADQFTYGGGVTLAPVPNQTIAQGGSATVTVSATDSDGKPLTYTATVVTQAYQLKQQYGFHSNGKLDYNWGGRKEKWFLGSGGAWYFILPTGAVYKWDGSHHATGTLIATLNPSYWANPALLYNATPTAGTILSWSGSELTVTPDPSFTGLLFVTVTASDGLTSASDTFTLTVT
jgi:hypothetical protein